MTAVLERGTLTAVDDQTQRQLEEAARAYKAAPAALRDAIIAAARGGDTPAAITRAIGYVYTYDYVARLVRDDRREHPGCYGS